MILRDPILPVLLILLAAAWLSSQFRDDWEFPVADDTPRPVGPLVGPLLVGCEESQVVGSERDVSRYRTGDGFAVGLTRA